MSAVHYIGDEIGAAGWRLSGAVVHVPATGAEVQALNEARHQADLVLVASDVAARIDAPTLHAAVAALAPLVLVVPDTQGRVASPDFATRLRVQLGLES